MPASTDISFASKGLEDLSTPHEVNVDPTSGAAQITVGIPLTSSRSEFNPNLSLTYSSSSSNSTFGIGWALSGVPSIAISLKDGLPKYDGTDKYAVGGAELVPWLEETPDGWQPRVLDGGDYWIHYYRNKFEQQFVRFEKWVNKATQHIHWRSRDRQNTLSIFGFDFSNTTKISDPTFPERIYQWLLQDQYDQYGNAIHYEYLIENAENINIGSTYERNRILNSPEFAQRHLKKIQYGNTLPLAPDQSISPDNQWLFEVVLDYGEHEGGVYPTYESTRSWPSRQDSFSSYRTGFEVRTYRLCRRVLMFHRFDELGTGHTLAGSLSLEHEENPVATILKSIHYDGYRREAGTDIYRKKSLPPLIFNYSKPELGRSFIPAPHQTNENAPYGIGGLNYRWIDLYGEGLPGILFENNQAWYYKSNLGSGVLGTQQKVLNRPSARLGDYSISDFDGNGNPNLVILQGREAGFYEYERDGGGWQGFQTFAAAPQINPSIGQTQLLDLNGDGRADIVSVKEDRITWYKSKGKEGFDSPVEFAKPRTNGVSQAPTIGSNLNLDYFFADMTGDGLPDQVRIINGRVEYWPQLGNGKFGVGVVMENAPNIDINMEFDASRIRLVDLDGSGTSDILYIGRGEIKYWINANGNRFIDGGTISGLPYIDNISSATVLDFLGNSTPCLVWSTTLPGRTEEPLQYLQLTNGVKPRLLNTVENSMGKEITLTYSNSASHYLRDKKSGNEWISKLPQHVIVVDQLEIIDHIGNTRAQSRYEYHDGFYDSEAREFRGFGLVDQYDTANYQSSADMPAEDYADPVCVRTWTHNGMDGWESRRSQAYYQEDALAARLPTQIIENRSEIHPDEFNHAFNALAGQPVRTELYGVSRSGKRATHPYQVTQTSYAVKQLQPKYGEEHTCFFTHARETQSYLYEQNPDDPRISGEFTLSIDHYGNITDTCAVAYARRSVATTDIEAQQQTSLTAAISSFVNIDERDRYFLGIPTQSRAFEVQGLTPSVDSAFGYDALKTSLNEALDRPLDFHQAFTTDEQARLIQWTRLFYWNDDRSEVLPWSEIGLLPLLHHSESSVYTNDLINDTFGSRLDATILRDQGHYKFKDNYWWQPSPTLHYLSARQFSMIEHEENLDSSRISYTYDEPYFLTLAALEDALGNQVRGSIDYHQIAPNRITDINDNVSEVQYDPLGVVVVSTQQGSVLSTSSSVERYGNDFLSDYSQQSRELFDDILAVPIRFLQGASQYFQYDLESWLNSRTPLRSVSLIRSEYVHDGEGGGISASTLTEEKLEIAVDYLDGFGRSLQSRSRVKTQWRATGQTIYDNKQQVVRQYEPFFSPTHDFELSTHGEVTHFRYDPLERLIQTDFSDGTLAKTEHTAWQTEQYDQNDAVIGSAYVSRIETEFPATDHPQRIALNKAIEHADTPTRIHLDPLGQEVVLEETGTGETRKTESTLDYSGQPIAVTDPRGLQAFTYRYDILGRPLFEHSIDAGDKWTFTDALDRSLHLWDSRDTHQQLNYDALGRVETVQVDGALGLNKMTERLVYGESIDPAEAKNRNARGQLISHHDQAGVLRARRYGVSGLLLESDRQLSRDYKQEPDWSDPDRVLLDDPVYTTQLQYDALERIKQQHLPDDTQRNFHYARGDGIQEVHLSTDDGEITDQIFLSEVEYNEKGQKTHSILGNGVKQSYIYDSKTNRLNQLQARLPGVGAEKVYQNIQYTYDPVGNITHTIDRVQQARSDVIRNLPADLSQSEFSYDAFYQLTQASGRVHQALLQHDYDPRSAGTVKGTRNLSLNDGSRVERYTRSYDYDLSGNLQFISHAGASQSYRTEVWTSPTSNRSLPLKDLNNIELPDPESRFDTNGNCLYLPHLSSFAWNYRNNLSQAVVIDRSDRGLDNDAEYYVYGGDGQRVRKVAEQQLASGEMEITEKIYLDGCEIKHIKVNDATILERTTSHISDGEQNIALLHQWATDTRRLETDDVSNKKSHYQLSNHLGSTSLEVDQAGNVISYEEYFPFGGTAFFAGNEREVRLKDYRYTGKERDDVTGLYYFGYRYYAAWIGNWLSPDPIGPEDGLNLYQFVGNNPLRFVDVDGLQSSRIIPLPDRFSRSGMDQELEQWLLSPSSDGGGGYVEVENIRWEDSTKDSQAHYAFEGVRPFTAAHAGLISDTNAPTAIASNDRFDFSSAHGGIDMQNAPQTNTRATGTAPVGRLRWTPGGSADGSTDQDDGLPDADSDNPSGDRSQVTENESGNPDLPSSSDTGRGNHNNNSESQSETENISLVPTDRMSFDPFDTSLPQITWAPENQDSRNANEESFDSESLEDWGEAAIGAATILGQQAIDDLAMRVASYFIPAIALVVLGASLIDIAMNLESFIGQLGQAADIAMETFERLQSGELTKNDATVLMVSAAMALAVTIGAVRMARRFGNRLVERFGRERGGNSDGTFEQNSSTDPEISDNNPVHRSGGAASANDPVFNERDGSWLEPLSSHPDDPNVHGGYRGRYQAAAGDDPDLVGGRLPGRESPEPWDVHHTYPQSLPDDSPIRLDVGDIHNPLHLRGVRGHRQPGTLRVVSPGTPTFTPVRWTNIHSELDLEIKNFLNTNPTPVQYRQFIEYQDWRWGHTFWEAWRSPSP
ncbi:MAG: SpvB/TcaC N-terminal domain-containing protein [Methylococcaceae bacterium]